jgi:hypothetical protein
MSYAREQFMTMLVAETGARFLAADRVWIATALLHRENPSREDFSLEEIRDRGRKEDFVEERTNVFYVHANQHCVANRPPNPGNHRMLTESAPGRRRLYRTGDNTRPGRTGKVVPRRDEIPPKYRPLLDWYQKWAATNATRSGSGDARETTDPLLRLRGSGREIWKHEHADEFVRNLRKGWE